MAVCRADDFYFAEMGNVLPPVCNGCSEPFDHGRLAPFVFWAFSGAAATQDGRALDTSSDPDRIERAKVLERLAERLGDCSEAGPDIALCARCARHIGQSLIEDGALLNAVLDGSPHVSAALKPPKKGGVL